MKHDHINIFHKEYNLWEHHKVWLSEYVDIDHIFIFYAFTNELIDINLNFIASFILYSRSVLH